MFSGGPSLAARLANIQHMPVLMAATVASDKPIDPYLMKDITKMSFESGQARAFLQQYLLHQLVTSRNVYVKFKVLKILEELLERGHIEFKRNLRKQPEPLNEASRLRATQSKDGGLMSECGRIRDLANKLLEVLYSDAPELQPKRYPAPEVRPVYSENSGSSRMEGFGNTPPVTQKSSLSATTDRLKVLFGSSTKSSSPGPLVYDESYATMDPVPHNVHGSTAASSGHYTSSTAGYNPGRYLEHGLPEGAPHRSGEAGGGWATDSVTEKATHTPQPQPAMQEMAHYNSTHHSQTISEVEERSTEQERRLVDDITGPGGVKPAPPRDSLNQFISRCKVLDCQAVVEFLRQKLQDQEQTQIVLRTLFVVEAMIKSDIPEVFSYLDLILEELHSLTQSPNSTIRAKAKKIMQQLLAVADSPVVSSSTGADGAGTGGMTTVESGAILDLDGAGEGEPVENLASETAPASVAGLFAGLSVSGQPPSSAPPRTGSQRHAHQKSSQYQATEAQVETGSPFADLLGLSSSEPTVQQQDNSHIKATAAPSDTRRVGEGELPPDAGRGGGEPLLMDLKDENFDPLANSLGERLLLSNQTAAPPTSLGSNGIISDLSELDLSVTSSQTDTRLQNGTGTGMLQPHQLSSPASSIPSHTHLLATMGGAYTGVQMPGQMAYVSTGPIPYGMQPGQAMGPQALVGIPAGYAAPQGAPIMYMNQPRIGGDARPVQRPQVTESTDQTSSFDFLGKSSKGSAFDFVKDEIDSAKKK